MANLMRYCQINDQEHSVGMMSAVDCIVGRKFDLETHQVKLFAVALSYEEEFFRAVLKVLKIPSCKDIDFDKSMVMSEVVLNDGCDRPDIIIDCRNRIGATRCLVLIEAKRIENTSIIKNSLKCQIERYRKSLSSDTKNVEIITIALVQSFCALKGTRILLWSDVVKIADFVYGKLKSDKGDSVRLRLFREFREKFISGGNRMKWFEEEVVSIPAGNTAQGVEKYGVYACGTDAKHTYRPFLFVTFRPSGGDMKVLYKVEGKYRLNPNVADIKLLDIDNGHKDRIIHFLNDKEASHYDYGKDGKDVMFYVLDQDHSIDLQQSPAHSFKQSPRGCVYYFLADILDPRKRRGLKPARSFRAKKKKQKNHPGK